MHHAAASTPPAAAVGASAPELPDELVARVRACFGSDVRFGAVDVPDKAKVVADDPLKRLIVDRRRRPRGVVFWAPAGMPGRIARDMDRLEQARRTLGEDLGEVVLEPADTGWVEERSYAIVPYRKPFADRGLAGHVHRASLRPSVLRWLERVTVQTHRPIEGDGDLREAIEHLASLPELAPSLRALAGEAGERLLNDGHRPRQVLCHNDLWAGNILRARGTRYGFVLIDWGASRADGYPIYDLLRVAVSLRLRPRALRRQIERHCAALGCEPTHAAGYLAGALGQLGLNRERFPLNRYVALVEDCFNQLRDAGLVGTER